MKKMISLALCLLLGCFVLAGCSNSSEPFEEKAIRRIRRSMKSILMCRTEKSKCRCPRTNKSIFNITKIVKSTTIFPFLTIMY